MFFNFNGFLQTHMDFESMMIDAYQFALIINFTSDSGNVNQFQLMSMSFNQFRSIRLGQRRRNCGPLEGERNCSATCDNRRALFVPRTGFHDPEVTIHRSQRRSTNSRTRDSPHNCQNKGCPRPVEPCWEVAGDWRAFLGGGCSALGGVMGMLGMACPES